MNLSARIAAYDAQGILIFDVPAKSFLRNFFSIFVRFMLVNRAGEACKRLVDGNALSLNAAVAQALCDGALGSDSYGIFIGTSATAVQIDQYDLQARLLNAVVNHGVTSIGATTENGGLTTWFCTISRSFTNVGAEQTIREVGLGCGLTGAGGNVLIDRTLVPAYVLPVAGVVSYQYTMQITI